MKLFIRLQNGEPVEHPILEENFIQIFPHIDINNLPEEFIEFVRKPEPSVLGVYEIYVGGHYEIIDGVCTDVHTVRSMTDEEKLAKQDAIKQDWAEHGYPSWIFDEITCSFKSPIGSYPSDDKIYKWDEDTISWIEIE
jgi:hypothetical protein